MKKYFIAICLILFSANAFATTRYFSPSGSGSTCSDGSPCSWATAYAASGSGDILVAKGGTYTNQWVITKSNLTVQKATGETPLIDGEFLRPSETEWRDDGLIRITGSNVIIDGISVTRSYERGIVAYGAARNATIKNCIISYTYMSGIFAGTEYVENTGHIVEDNTVTYGNFCWDGATTCCGASNPGCDEWQYIVNNIGYQGGYNIIRGNTVAYGSWAGIEGYVDENSIIEDNTVYGNRMTGIHVAYDNYTTIRNNLIYGRTRPNPAIAYVSGRFDSDGYGTGIAINVETWSPWLQSGWDTGHTVYGNMVANCSPNLEFGGTPNGNPNYMKTIDNCQIYNNTFLYPDLTHGENWEHVSIRTPNNELMGTGNVIKNNIFWQDSGSFSEDSINGAKITMGYNLWSRIPGTTFRASTDSTYPTYANQTLANYFAKTSGWNSTTLSISAADFALLDTATEGAIDKGEDLGLGNDIGALQYGDDPDPPDPPDPGTGNLAQGKTVSASSEESTELAAEYAVDGSTGTRWSSDYVNDADPDAAWFKVDLGAAYDIDRVTLRWETAYGLDYTIQTSTNDVDWTTRVTVDDGNGDIDDHSFVAASARYVKMVGTDRGTVYGYSLYEFEVYGESSPPLPTITANCWSDSAGTCLSANQVISQAGQKIYHKFTLDEAGYHLNGPTAFASAITVNATGSRALTFSAADQPSGMGYGQTSFLLSYSPVVGDKASGSLQLASGTLGGQIVDDEGNTFDMTGLDTSLTYTPSLSVLTAQQQTITVTGQGVTISITGQGLTISQ